MTTDRDFDRLARAWLDLGPDEAPERTVTAILLAAETMPQVRRRLRWPAWRDLSMSRSPILIGVWAMLLVTVAAIALLGRPEQHDAVTAPNSSSKVTDAPTASPTGAATLDPRLVGQWIGDRRPILGISLDQGARLIVSDDGTTVITPANNPGDQYLLSNTSTDLETMRVKTGADPRGDCANGDAGTYVWSPSPNGRLMTIAAMGDDCVARLASMVGTWWRVGCHQLSDGCLGDLDPGTYQSAFIKLRHDPSNQAAHTYGNVTYTVPDGWADASDTEGTLELEPADVYATVTAGEEPPHEVMLLAHPTIAAQDAACTHADERGVQRTVAGLMQAIALMPSLTTSAPTSISIGGLHGQMIDVTMAPSWRGSCPGTGGVRSASVLREAGSGDAGWSGYVTEQDHGRLIVLDLGGGDLAAIGIVDNQGQASFDAFVGEAMPIVLSLKFN